uniref:MHsp60, mHsp10, Mitochondrial, Chaperonin, Complex, Symmetric n=1 Tax=CrAss-like virus sp. ctWDt29 TaxID=2825836 RepID=A0A8S5NVZ4_9CAUD|nr:MAG TPA: mHsp60, mHsp10, Mitochondrial, Chaperonin, Complex, Symmetric [CrAss-like virus sp. ctWDt29]
MLHVTKIKPLFDHLLITADRFEKDMIHSGVILAKKGDLKLWQTVVDVGSVVRDIKVGDKVMINPNDFAVKKYNKNSVQNDLDNNPVITYNFPFETVDDEKGNPKDYLYISDRNVKYVFEGIEKDDSLILPGKPKLII